MGLIFRAAHWPSDDTDSPSTTFTQSAVPYVRVDDVTVADSWADLTDSTLLSAIEVDENGNHVAVINAEGGRPEELGPNLVFTGTGANGEIVNHPQDFSCTGWTSIVGAVITGVLYRVDHEWTLRDPSPNVGCESDHRLYCFEQ